MGKGGEEWGLDHGLPRLLHAQHLRGRVLAELSHEGDAEVPEALVAARGESLERLFRGGQPVGPASSSILRDRRFACSTLGC